MKFLNNKFYAAVFRKIKSNLTQEKFETFELDFHKDVFIHSEYLNQDTVNEYLQKILEYQHFVGEEEEEALESEEQETLREFDLHLQKCSKLVNELKSSNIEFVDSLEQVRNQYLNLKEKDKFKLIKEKPELLLSFYELEERLINSGVILPEEVSKKLTKEKNNRNMEKIYDYLMSSSNVNSEALQQLHEVKTVVDKRKSHLESHLQSSQKLDL
jgi:hypothetical protein